ncbi:P-loop NTPase family protein [Vagococcus acidifermentans]|uniref:ABC transporter domain-containing protein n=2 Tax=Vagococcus acidifermentans TaxID=564710 RepID=A0A430AVN6_9ENTE|nr:hypothetical protein CBF27_06725 [Vagococcus acidifermentans]
MEQLAFRAIINGPAVLLVDEPTGNLDQENSKIVMVLLSSLNEQGLAKYSSRIIDMQDGHITEKAIS